MSGTQKHSVRVSATGVRSESVAPAHAVRITTDAVKDPGKLAAAVARMQKAVSDVSRASQASPRLRATVFEGVAFTSGSTTAPIRHGYGMAVRYQVVRWQGSAACGYSEATNDGTTLILNAYATGTADVEVWPVS